MNYEKIERFDVNYFNKLNQEDKEKYFMQYIKKALGLDKKEVETNVN